MYTHLCPFQQPSLPRPPAPKRKMRSPGQALVIFAISLTTLILFVGLALDAGSMYVTYGQLKRAVDAAAVAAANDFKRGRSVDDMEYASLEVLRLHDVDLDTTTLDVYICDNDTTIGRDDYLQIAAPIFYARCPTSLEAPRKLVWIDATQDAPLYFLGLLGFGPVHLHTNAIAEAAPVDVVIVFDTSESMSSDTQDDLRAAGYDITDKYAPNNGDAGYPFYSSMPTGCNVTNTCQPLLQAKEAALALIDTLYEGYDQVGIVTFDTTAVIHPIINRSGNSVRLSDNLTHAGGASDVIESIRLHDDAPYAHIWYNWRHVPSDYDIAVVNPVNPEDRDGNGVDADPGKPCTLDADRWDDTQNPNGWGGVPCDDDNLLDAYDWNDNDVFDQSDHDSSFELTVANNPGNGQSASMSFLSTCTGCGIRVAGNLLKQDGRPNAVWVIIFLSDGMVNLSDTPGGSAQGDTPDTGGGVSTYYRNGFCSGSLNVNWWQNALCTDLNRMSTEPRYCMDTSSATCPPGTTYTTDGTINLPFNVLNYAMDKIDEVALTTSTNFQENLGNDIAIYVVLLGSTNEVAENLLRYMAAVGDDGDRDTDPCASTAPGLDCGQYYFAPSGNALLPIFEDIATRIYTRITE